MPKNIEQIFKKIEEAKNIIAKIQAQLKDQRVGATAGAGLVRVVANGNQEIVEVHIDPELIQMKDRKLLQDLIKAAVNQAKEKALKVSQELVKKTAGFNHEDLKKWLPI